jgi:hypothetical protein
MGFRVDVADRSDRALLKLLRSRPSEVFGKPYLGYLLFLTGGADRNILEWVAANAVNLDSLTGDDLAFAVFARRFTFKLRVPNYPMSHEKRQRNLREISLEDARDPYTLTHLCKSGQLGWVLDGDEVTAITYAVDELARGLGVTEDLPCLIVLDALPNLHFDILHLDNHSTERLIPLLRRASARLREPSTYERYRHLVARITSLEQEAENQRQHLEQLNLSLQQLQLSVDNAHVDPIENLRKDLLSASIRRFRSAVQTLPSATLEQIAIVGELATFKHGLLLRYARTLHALADVERQLAEADEVLSNRYAMICDEHVRPLLGEHFPIGGASIDSIRVVMGLLAHHQQSEVDLILTHLPSKHDITKYASAEPARLVQAELGKIAEKRQRISRIDEEILLNLKVLADLKHPTLSSIFASLAKEDRLKTVRRSLRDQASSFLGGLFKPDNLMKYLQAIAG